MSEMYGLIAVDKSAIENGVFVMQDYKNLGHEPTYDDVESYRKELEGNVEFMKFIKEEETEFAILPTVGMLPSIMRTVVVQEEHIKHLMTAKPQQQQKSSIIMPDGSNSPIVTADNLGIPAGAALIMNEIGGRMF